MRVVAGSHRGRPLRSPPGGRTRPTSDRVREAMFNALNSRGGVEGDRVLDLFAGTGALGIEALSRGAAHVTFVERDRGVLAVLRANLDDLDLGDRSTVVAADALRWVEDGAASQEFDLALLDPPYAFDAWERLLSVLPAGRAVIESDRAVEVPPGWVLVRQKGYGGTIVTFVERI